MVRLESNNVTLTSNLGIVALGENGSIPAYFREKNLEELRDLINDFLELKAEKPLEETS